MTMAQAGRRRSRLRRQSRGNSMHRLWLIPPITGRSTLPGCRIIKATPWLPSPLHRVHCQPDFGAGAGKLIELRPRSPLHGTWIAFAVWLGFVSTVQLTDGLFSKKPFKLYKLYAINTGYQLVCYLVMGTILAAWAS